MAAAWRRARTLHVSAGGGWSFGPLPFSDASLHEMSRAEASRSPFMRALRASDVHLAKTQGGCALWAQREQVLALL